MKLKIITIIGILTCALMLICAVMIYAYDRKEARGPISNKTIEIAVTDKLHDKFGTRAFRVDYVKYRPVSDCYEVAIADRTKTGLTRKITRWICHKTKDGKGYNFQCSYASYDPRISDPEIKFTMIIDEHDEGQTSEMKIYQTDTNPMKVVSIEPFVE